MALAKYIYRFPFCVICQSCLHPQPLSQASATWWLHLILFRHLSERHCPFIPSDELLRVSGLQSLAWSLHRLNVTSLDGGFKEKRAFTSMSHAYFPIEKLFAIRELFLHIDISLWLTRHRMSNWKSRSVSWSGFSCLITRNDLCGGAHRANFWCRGHQSASSQWCSPSHRLC